MLGNVPGRAGTDGLWLYDKSVGLHVLQQFCGGAWPALATLWPLGRAVLQHGRTAEVRAGRPLTDTAAHPGNFITFLVLRCSVRSNDSFKIRNNNILTFFILHPVKLQNWSNDMSVLVILCLVVPTHRGSHTSCLMWYPEHIWSAMQHRFAADLFLRPWLASNHYAYTVVGCFS